MNFKKYSLLIVLLVLGVVCNLKSFGQTHKVPVYAATSNGHQGNDGPLKTIDNDRGTMYHSPWSVSAMPDKVTYYFNTNVKSVKKIVYVPSSGVNGRWQKLHVSYATQENPTTLVRILTDVVWENSTSEKTIDLPNEIKNPYLIQFDVIQATNNFSSCVEMEFYSFDPVIENSISCNYNTNELVDNFSNDVKAAILTDGSTTTSVQPGAEFVNAFDNNPNTMYHSKWSSNPLPVTLNFRLNGTTPIDYLRYVPRHSGYNGNFGEVTISYNTVSNSNYQELMKFDFLQESAAKRVLFPKSITPLNIRIVVHNSESNDVSIGEMEFYTAKSIKVANQPSGIFTNNLCNELQKGVTQQQINGISSAFYKDLAQCIFDGKYVSKRTKSYDVYPSFNSINREYRFNGRNQYENPTGIYFNKDEKIVVFLESSPIDIYLKIKDFKEGTSGGSLTAYLLKPGINVFTAGNKGLAYINYYSADKTLPNIKANIVTGKFNDVFKKNSSTGAEWRSALSDTENPIIDLVSDNLHLVTYKEDIKKYFPMDPTELMEHFDEIIGNQYMLMGLYKYNRVPKNRMFAYSGYIEGFFASYSGVNLYLNWNGSSANVLSIKNSDFWGIAHEFGHNNQLTPFMKFPGLIEVTNNIFSTWNFLNTSRLPSKLTRLETESRSPNHNGLTLSNVKAGAINASIFKKVVSGETYFVTGFDPLTNLVPLYQLMLYYSMSGASKGAPILTYQNRMKTTHSDGVDYANWHGSVMENFRNPNLKSGTNGENWIKVIETICDVVKEDLTDFFAEIGMLKPTNQVIGEYSDQQYLITADQVAQTISSIKSKGYKKPVSSEIKYMSAHSINTFKDKIKLSGVTGTGYTVDGEYYIVNSNVWKNVIAYETKDANEKLIYASITGTGDDTNVTTKVYFPSTAKSIYAVGFDGERRLVYPVRSAEFEITIENEN